RLRRITVFRRPGFYGSLAGVAVLLALAAVLLGQGTPPAGTAPEGKSAGEKSAAVSPPAPAATTPEAAARELLAAARAGDVAKLRGFLDSPSPSNQPALQALDELLKKRELAGYTLLVDEMLRRQIGKGWRVSNPDLASLVQEGRTDFLDALLARRLD